MNDLAHIYPINPPTKLPTTNPKYIPISPHPNMKQNIYANSILKVKYLKNVIIMEVVPFPMPWNIIADIAPNGREIINKDNIWRAVASCGIKVELTSPEANNGAICGANAIKKTTIKEDIAKHIFIE